jgi:putative ABC transport system permease protein
MLLTGALLMVQTVRDLRGLDIGLDPVGVSVHYLPLESHGYKEDTALSYNSQVLDALTHAPGVEAVSLSEGHPFGSSSSTRIRRPDGDREPTRVYFNEVTPDYFRVLRIPILRGRGFSAAEATGSASVGGALPVIISESLGRQFYGDEDPLGRRLESAASFPGRDIVVVGVARDAQWRGLIEAPEPMLYVPFRQGTSGGSRSTACAGPSKPPRRRSTHPCRRCISGLSRRTSTATVTSPTAACSPGRCRS